MRGVNVVSYTRLVNTRDKELWLISQSEAPKDALQVNPFSEAVVLKFHPHVTSDVRDVCCTLSRQMKQDVSNAWGSDGPEFFVLGCQNTQSLFMKRVDVSGR
jgi:hypothetical protein